MTLMTYTQMAWYELLVHVGPDSGAWHAVQAWHLSSTARCQGDDLNAFSGR